MTGFGRSEFSVGGRRFGVELKALNHRYLELRPKLPRSFAQHEHFIRGRLSKALGRGRVDVSVSPLDGDGEAPTAFTVNRPLVEALRRGHEAIAEILGGPAEISVRSLAQTPGVLVPTDELGDEAAIQAALGVALDEAVAALKIMRSREGEALGQILSEHLEAMAGHVGFVDGAREALSQAYQQRIEGRLQDTLARLGAQIDPARVLHEVALYAEKTDVAEEIDRLKTHIQQARGYISGAERADEKGVGRRLDFLFQEMNREVNTIGSKIQDLEISRRVVELKVELERLREQVQNVE